MANDKSKNRYPVCDASSRGCGRDTPDTWKTCVEAKFIAINTNQSMDAAPVLIRSICVR